IRRSVMMLVLGQLVIAAVVSAQGAGSTAPTPTAPPVAAPPPTPAATPPFAPATTPPPSPVPGVRSKVSAGDLWSAESILEVHRSRHGEDGPWLVGYAWLARGALLLGHDEKADRYAAAVHALCAERIAKGADLAKDNELTYALGAVIEVVAQRLQRQKGKAAAIRYVHGEMERWGGPVWFRSRLQKRINMMDMEGARAPEWVVEESVGGTVPTLASLSGKPVVLYVWDKGCGDCSAQSGTLSKVYKRYRDDVHLVTLTRHYDEGAQRATELARVDSVWKASYADIGAAPIIVSDASMVRYGGSSTPTFVFIDRKGIVRRYTPTRLTEDELDRTISDLLR
ncbi:MAG: TlpA family protein disulfide reductase, partial [bacterium]